MDNKSNSSSLKNNTFELPRKLNIWLPLLFSFILVAGMFIGVKMVNNPPTIARVQNAKKETLPPGSLGQGKLEELIRYIEAKYVDNVNKDFLVKEAIGNILYQLDPHSSYISSESLKSINDQLEGNFDGIGIEFVVIDDTVMVTGVIPNSPAESAGILANDKIVEIHDSAKIYQNIDHQEMLRMLKGEKGTKVTVGVLRNNESKLRHFTVVRDKIQVRSVEAAYMLDEKSGYVRIARFSSRTFEEFMNALDDLVDNHKMKNLVLDLRENPGGYLQEATNILSQLFLEKDKLLVYTKGKNVNDAEYKSTGRAFHAIGNVAVLVDEGTASASEIIAGAVQDWDRGVIIGRRTYGKGLVQEQYGLRDGSAIRLTVARYYTPSGRCIQKPYSGNKDYDHDLALRLESGEIFDEMVFENSDTTHFYTKAGRVVYGGGGIQPDIFIPMNSVLLHPYHIRLQRHVAPFVFRYLETNRKDVEGMEFQDYLAKFSVSEDLANKFLAFVFEHGESRNEANWRFVKSEILNSIKATIARNLWSATESYTVRNSKDPVILKAVRLLQEDNPLKPKGGN